MNFIESIRKNFISFYLRTLFSFACNCEGQEPTGYAALSLINHNFLPKTSPNESLPFLCRTPTISDPSIAAAAVDAIQPEMVEDVGKGRTEEEMDTGGNTETLNACTEGWESFEGKCYKVCAV